MRRFGIVAVVIALAMLASAEAVAASTLAARWGGSTWSTQATPNPLALPAGELLSVSCASRTTCFSVGDSTKVRNIPTPMSGLAERWIGRRWSIAPTAPERSKDAGGLPGSLSGVSCASTRDCFAVGSLELSGVGSAVALVERWIGTGWERVPAPTGRHGSLYAVSCTSGAACTAVGAQGRYGQLVLVERWNGRRWLIQRTPTVGGKMGAMVSAVSCASDTDCTAVGESFLNTLDPTQTYDNVTLVERWNGSRWAIQPTPNPLGAKHSVLNGVSCTSASDCTAVGDYSYNYTETGGLPGGTAYVLVERWNGTTWSIEPTPNATASGGSGLSGVSCSSPTACTAVGGSSNKALVERWDGSSWSIQPLRGRAGQRGASLSAVSCISPDACTAVGSY
jgi:hypothetical protein